MIVFSVHLVKLEISWVVGDQHSFFLGWMGMYVLTLAKHQQ